VRAAIVLAEDGALDPLVRTERQRPFTAHVKLDQAAAEKLVADAHRTIVNWDVAAADWNLLKRRAHDDWIKLSSK